MFEVLDLCDTVHSSPQRSVTTVAPQALTLFNGDFVNEQARHLAARLKSEAGQDLRKQIDHAYHLALCRAPTRVEMTTMLEFERTEVKNGSAKSLNNGDAQCVALEQICRVILNLNEFAYAE
jgi:hypothetical protein